MGTRKFLNHSKSNSQVSLVFRQKQNCDQIQLQHRKIQNASMEILIILLFSFFLTSAKAIDTISPTQSIRDGGQTIVSADGSFELGFFSIKSNRYLGVWFKKISQGTVVWVANRQIPLSNSSGLLQFDDRGSLILLNHENLTIWSANSSRPVQNPIAQLLDSGNFVIRDEKDVDPENYLWQSFRHPDKTFMPGMKIGRLAGGLEVNITSWKSLDDPSKGEYSYQLDSSGSQTTIARNSVLTGRSGPWNGIGQSGFPFLRPNTIFNYSFVMSVKEDYYTFEMVNKSVFTRLVLNEIGVLSRYAWIERTQQWQRLSYAPADNCDTYDICGAHGSCDVTKTPVCSCLNRFVPKLENNWNSADWSDGCVRQTPLDCERGDGFIKYSNIKLPDMLNYSTNSNLTMEECEMFCLKNCSCMAYASSNIVTRRGCYFWFGDLIDIKKFNDDGGQDIFIRMAYSELDESSSSKKRRVLVASLVSSAGTFLLILCICLFIRNKRRKQKKNSQGRWENNAEENYSTDNHDEDLELPHFDFIVVARATNNFSFDGMLGEGGFGPVYKGMLRDGQEVAVKRLCKESRQGLHEFMNELKCIAKLQHRNLVKLLGYCVYLDERMLIYEYMPNKSLDCYIFDDNQSKLLDWNVRFRIIIGISRGLLYLHQDSRLRIIHRDLKLSNVLLDKEMNPKISDFGMAKIFGGNETAAKTKRVVGTYGYMSPEYAFDGLFSMKSDVFSFGVLVLEIISGQRNRGFTHPDHELNLLGHAWKLFKEGRYLELIDDSTMETCSLSEVLRTIHVGLLCVQHNPEDRPNMSLVVLMLSSEGPLPEPNEPGFFTERKLLEGESASSKQNLNSVNELTITLIDAR
ncbi:G-type lectin S-receptor-like serine/threonine-protein kinase At4g27290 [Mercurialis annua]|uniref:G-type lectin S-receptor-like serine/threonine-protein kinase At4g27290 n=1 Tax=Mercurialis annua TaxID=3986 RepID=UPI00215F7B45|nr:G-type lectin S-receptor-like serine/threonine-protein kinase At4g27290 [Mercurialis annua]